ncbi:transmembrane protein 67 [Trypanosoma rangeli]|uniref:Transmembrane protein 67 n=1 Tax=Trypanosoma rangeli TaxID=5698 RepID=A0A422N7X9_TRYRA|nr:transmembrane protein 67 [Trypanosoma rangeli]RNF01570.1 transmembrane protein 67 [Trypanosoma rangeli]|eukprot:RNF01570.1 transmembrane protein 67 [Trypanosoma rangeli]
MGRSLVARLSWLLLCIWLPALFLSVTYCASGIDDSVRTDTCTLCHLKSSCKHNMVFADESVVDAGMNCSERVAPMEPHSAGTAGCVDCTRTEKVVGMALYANPLQCCVHCGDTRMPPGAVNPVYYETTGERIRRADYEPVDQESTQGLASPTCVQHGSNGCARCELPHALAESEKCVCASGYTILHDGSCVPAETYANVVAAAAGATTMFQPVNINNDGILGPTFKAVAVGEYATEGAVQCACGRAVGCNLLANMCVLMMYDMNSLPCKLYLSLVADRNLRRQLPKLVYDNNTGNHTNYDGGDGGFPAATLKATRVGEVITLLVAVYDWRGNKKGIFRFSKVFNPCHISDTAMSDMFKFVSNRGHQCVLDWDVLLRNAGPTDFFELFMVDPTNMSHLVPLSVVMDYTNNDIHPWSFHEELPQQAMTGGYRRRFYVHDTFTDCKVGLQQAPVKVSCYVTALRYVVFVFNMTDFLMHHRPLKPIIIFHYASGLRHNDTLLVGTATKVLVKGGVSVLFFTEKSTVDMGMMITMIVLSVLCFLSAWIRTYGWMRRRQNMMLSIGACIRFLAYFCDHIGNMFALAVALASWYILVMYRAQENKLGVVVNERHVYLEAMLFTATVTKGIAVVYRIVEQCNADYFVIDWERSKGQLLRENRILPVSMWRSTFVSNELNELQGLRQWRPLLSMSIVLFFLEELDFLRYTESLPAVSEAEEVGLHSLTSLRIAVGMFFWVFVCLALNILEFQIYYRFFRVHPLRAFVDLCSVSNISILILPETQWGYYIHGESIHAHSDVSMEEFQRNLYLESQGNLPVRGLGGQNKCQTFEVFMGIYMRQYLYMCYAEIEAEHQRSLGKGFTPVRPGRRWHFLECVLGFSRKSRVYDSETLAVKKRINTVLQQSVQSAEGTLLMKFILHRLFGVTPNILYMNGPQSGDRSGKDLFFVDDALAYGNAFLYGLDIDLFVWYTLMYASFDAFMHNVWMALVITFAVEVVVRWYRMNEGVANISSKTLIDDRFFL